MSLRQCEPDTVGFGGKLTNTCRGPAEDRYASGVHAGRVDRVRGFQSRNMPIVGKCGGAR